MTAIVRRNCLRLILVSGLWIGVFSVNDAPVAAQPPESCGNGICEQINGETAGNCPADCRESICGDDICDDTEVGWCQEDCQWCGDGYCHPFEQDYCYQDCGFPEICGDNVCLVSEFGWCIDDCGWCGDAYCESHEQTWCFQDCAP